MNPLCFRKIERAPGFDTDLEETVPPDAYSFALRAQ